MQSPAYFTFGWEYCICLDWILFFTHILFAQAMALSAEGGAKDFVFVYILHLNHVTFNTGKQSWKLWSLLASLSWFSFSFCAVELEAAWIPPSFMVLRKINRGCFLHWKSLAKENREEDEETMKSLQKGWQGKEILIISYIVHYHIYLKQCVRSQTH